MHNPHRIIAVIPASIAKGVSHQPTKDQEIAVAIPCFFEDTRSVDRRGIQHEVRDKRMVEVSLTPRWRDHILKGTLLRFREDPTNYYRIFDIENSTEVLGSSYPTAVCATTRQNIAVGPTLNRTTTPDSPATDSVPSDVDDSPANLW